MTFKLLSASVSVRDDISHLACQHIKQIISIVIIRIHCTNLWNQSCAVKHTCNALSSTRSPCSRSQIDYESKLRAMRGSFLIILVQFFTVFTVSIVITVISVGSHSSHVSHWWHWLICDLRDWLIYWIDRLEWSYSDHSDLNVIKFITFVTLITVIS